MSADETQADPAAQLREMVPFLLLAGWIGSAVFMFVGLEILARSTAADPTEVEAELKKLASFDEVKRAEGASALRTLASINSYPDAAVPALIDRLHDTAPVGFALVYSDGSTNGAMPGSGTCPGAIAAGALGEIGDLRALEPLIAATKSADDSVRRSAVEALGNLGDARALDAIEQSDVDRVTKSSARERIEKLGISRREEREQHRSSNGLQAIGVAIVLLAIAVAGTAWIVKSHYAKRAESSPLPEVPTGASA